MLFVICLLIALAFLALAVLFLIRKTWGKFRVVPAFCTGIVMTYVLCLPLFLTEFDTLTALLANLVNVTQVISFGADYLMFSDIVRAAIGSGWLSSAYLIVLALTVFAMPVMSAVTAYTVLLFCLARIRMSFACRRKRPLFVFSCFCDNSRRLAHDIKRRVRVCDIVFCGCDEKTARCDDARALGAICKDDAIGRMRVRTRSGRDVYFLCMSDDEDANLDDALQLMKTGFSEPVETQKRTRIILFSERSTAEPLIDSADKGLMRLRIVNRSQMITWDMLDRCPLYYGAKERQIRLLICGLGKVGTEFLKGALWCGQLAGYSLKITVLGRDIDNAVARLRYDMPGAFRGQYDVQFHSCGNDLEFAALLDKYGRDATYAVVDMGGDAENTDTAVRLRRFLYAVDPQFQNAPVVAAYIRQESSRRIVERLHTPESNPERRVNYSITAFGDDSTVLTYDALIDSRLDALAKNVHLTYEEIYSEGTPISVDKALENYNLLEVDKRSNLANALHIRYKLRLLGLDYTDDPNAEEADFAAALTPERLDLLADMEHSRWMAFLETEGWQTASLKQVEAYKASGISAGRHKNPLLKMHPYMCPFEDLVARSQALELLDATVLDRELIARIPDILHDKWDVSGKRYRIVRMKD